MAGAAARIFFFHWFCFRASCCRRTHELRGGLSSEAAISRSGVWASVADVLKVEAQLMMRLLHIIARREMMMTREEAPRESTGGPEVQGSHYLQTWSSWILRPIVLSFSYADDRTALKLRNIACNPSDLAYCSASFHMSSSTLIQLPAMVSSNRSAHKLLHLPAVLGGKPATKRQLP